MSIVIRPEAVGFTETDMEMISSNRKKYKIPYEHIIIASLKTKDEVSGGWYEPEITDLTKDMDGELVLKDDKNCQWLSGQI